MKTEHCNCCGVEFGDGEGYAPWPPHKDLEFLSGTDQQGDKTYCCDDCQREAIDLD